MPAFANTPVLPALLAAVLISFAITYCFLHDQQREVLGKLFVVQEELSETKEALLGYTRFTNYLTESKAAISEQMKFLAAKVDREYVHVQHIQTSTLGISSDATIILRYAVEYSFGFDLRPEQFAVTGDKNGITVTISKPELVASPAGNSGQNDISVVLYLPLDNRIDVIPRGDKYRSPNDTLIRYVRIKMLPQRVAT
jgi:hypothetical protein